MKIHFIGIGGIGTSALAQYYSSCGKKVSGSDIQSSEITELLEKKGIKIYFGHKKENLKKGTSLVIYSQAIPKDNPEIIEAKRKNILIKSYPEALGDLTKKFFTIAIAGTHGKGTTLAMISLILIEANFDPTVIIGTRLKEFGDSNFRLGKSKYLLIEADEYKDAFLKYYPKAIVLTNIEKEHLDYFGNFASILKSYQRFISKLPKNGILILNKDDQGIKELCKKYDFLLNLNPKFYSLSQEKEIKKIKKILKIPGRHNLLNALAAFLFAKSFGISEKIILKGIGKFKGAWRRFEEKKLKVPDHELILINDYAHHPTEIQATLEAARERYQKKEILLIFQPHQRQRTFFLFNDFVKVFVSLFKKKIIQELIFDEIFEVKGREEDKIKISSEDLKKTILKQIPNFKNKIFYLQGKERILKFLKENFRNYQVIVIMGAGDIYRLQREIESLKRKS